MSTIWCVESTFCTVFATAWIQVVQCSADREPCLKPMRKSACWYGERPSNECNRMASRRCRPSPCSLHASCLSAPAVRTGDTFRHGMARVSTVKQSLAAYSRKCTLHYPGFCRSLSDMLGTIVVVPGMLHCYQRRQLSGYAVLNMGNSHERTTALNQQPGKPDAPW